MTIESTKDQQRVVDLAVASGAYHDSGEVIDATLSMLYDDIEDGVISDARRSEPSVGLEEVEAELRKRGKL
jgi:hypothetical protein